MATEKEPPKVNIESRPLKGDELLKRIDIMTKQIGRYLRYKMAFSIALTKPSKKVGYWRPSRWKKALYLIAFYQLCKVQRVRTLRKGTLTS